MSLWPGKSRAETWRNAGLSLGFASSFHELAACLPPSRAGGRDAPELIEAFDSGHEFVPIPSVQDIAEHQTDDMPLPSAGRLVAVVVTHDRPRQLTLTIKALLATPPDLLAAVLVVDNASKPGSMAALDSITDPRLICLKLERNLGGAGGFEAGMRHAMSELQPDWLVLMDDDARPEPEALAVFHRLDLTGWDALAAAVRYPDGRLCEMNRPTLNPFLRPQVMLRALAGRGREAFHLTEQDYTSGSLREVDGASFVGFFVSRRVIERVGFPDGKLFLYADDAIYTQAMTRAGYRLAFVPEMRFIHDSSTFSTSDGRIRPLWKAYYYYRNLIFLYRQAAGRWFWPVMLVYLPRWAARVWQYRGQRRDFLRVFGRAVRDGLGRRTDATHAEIRALARTDSQG